MTLRTRWGGYRWFAAVETLALVENAAAHGIAFYVVVVAVYHGVLFFELFG